MTTRSREIRKAIEPVLESLFVDDGTWYDPEDAKKKFTAELVAAILPLMPKEMPTTEPDLLDGIIHFEKIGAEKLAKGETWPHRDKIPEPIRELLDVYVKITGQRPTKKVVNDWLLTGQDWLDLGIKEVDLQNAYEKANPEKGDGFTVARPGSLTNTANMFAGKRRTNGGTPQTLEQSLENYGN